MRRNASDESTASKTNERRANVDLPAPAGPTRTTTASPGIAGSASEAVTDGLRWPPRVDRGKEAEASEFAPVVSGRPTQLLPWGQLLNLSAYWVGLTAIWAGLDAAVLPARLRDIVGDADL